MKTILTSMARWSAVLALAFSSYIAALGADVTGDRLNIGTGHSLSGKGATIAAGTNNLTGADFAVVLGGSYSSATGTNSVIAGGKQNTNTANYAAIGGGLENVVKAEYSLVAGGLENTVLGTYSAIGGGLYNFIAGNLWAGTIGGGGYNTNDGAYYGTIAGGAANFVGYQYATIGGGGYNRATGDSDTIAGGAYNTNSSALFGTIGGGAYNQSEHWYATIPGGTEARADKYAQMAYSSGKFADFGDAQSSLYVVRCITTTNTQKELFLDGDGGFRQMTIDSGSTWTYDVLVTARNSSGLSFGYQVRGVIDNDSGTTHLVGTQTTNALGNDVGATWSVSVLNDNTNKALVVKVTGDSTTIRWVAAVRTVEVKY